MLKSTLVANALAIMIWGSFLAPLAAESPADDKGKDRGFPDLVGALKAVPGCLGVETAKTESGKLVIFAWFENKQAALKWYHSDTHQAVIKRFFPSRKLSDHPLAGVPDDGGPVMAVASVTVNEDRANENRRPFKQIAIELYKPLPGGLSLGGRFAPDKMKIPPPARREPQ